MDPAAAVGRLIVCLVSFLCGLVLALATLPWPSPLAPASPIVASQPPPSKRHFWEKRRAGKEVWLGEEKEREGSFGWNCSGSGRSSVSQFTITLCDDEYSMPDDDDDDDNMSADDVSGDIPHTTCFVGSPDIVPMCVPTTGI